MHNDLYVVSHAQDRKQHRSMLPSQEQVGRFLDTDAEFKKKVVKNMFIFGAAVVVLYNWEVIIGDLDAADAPTA